MNKLFKRLALVFTGTILLAAAAAVAVVFLIDPNEYKEEIAAVVQDRTGHRVDIPGDISLHLSPTLDAAFTLGAIHIASAAPFADTPLLTSSDCRLRLSILPLLIHRQIKVNQLQLTGMTLNLLRNKEGQVNWSLTGRDQSASSDKTQATPEASSSGLIDMLDIGGLDLKEINLRFQDQQAGSSLELQDLRVETGAIRVDTPFQVKTGFSFLRTQAGRQPLAVTANGVTNLTLGAGGGRFLLDGMDFALNLAGKPLPAAIDLRLTGDLALEPAQESLVIKHLQVQQGDVAGDLHLQLQGFTHPALTAGLELKPFAAGALLTRLGLPYRPADAAALSRVSGKIELSGAQDNLDINTLQLKVDDSTIQGSVRVIGLDKPAIKLGLQVDQLDLDRYLPVAADTAPARQGAESQTPSDRPIFPMELLHKLDLAGKLEAGRLRVAKVNLAEVSLTLDARNGKVTAAPMSATLYGGRLQADAVIDATGPEPAIRFSQQLVKVNLDGLLTDMTGRAEVTGRATADAKIHTRGQTRKQLLSHANGTMNVHLTDGRIERLRLLETVRQAKALLDKEPYTPPANAQPTGFAALSATGKLTDGVLANNDLEAASDLMSVQGNGTVDLAREQVDYLLTIRLTDRVERHAESGLVSLGDRPIPYRIRGSFDNLEQSAVMEELLKSEIKNVLLNELQKKISPKESGGKETPPATDPGKLLEQGLKGLFGN